MSYDPECEKLADYFLTDVVDLSLSGTDLARERRLLAQHIEDAIDAWMQGFWADQAREEKRS